MGTEIERKFLVKYMPEVGIGIPMFQGYLFTSETQSLRLRIEQYPTVRLGTLTYKAGQGIERPEFPFDLLREEVEQLQPLCTKSLNKTRYTIPASDDLSWEIDVYEGELLGLLIAEIELDEQDQEFEKPDWLGEEVTGDPKYLNQNLAK